jgi:hypothetical protein
MLDEVADGRGRTHPLINLESSLVVQIFTAEGAQSFASVFNLQSADAGFERRFPTMACTDCMNRNRSWLEIQPFTDWANN